MLCRNSSYETGTAPWSGVIVAGDNFEIAKSYSCNLILITVIHCYFVLLQSRESQWTYRAASSCMTVSRNCVMQMAHYVVATRLEWGATLLRWYLIPGSKEIGYEVLTDLPRRESFPFRSPHDTFAITARNTENFITRRGRIRGVSINGNGLGFISRKISFMRHVARGGQKYAGEKRTPMEFRVRAWRTSAWVVRASRDSFELFRPRESVLIMYICNMKRKGGGNVLR